jgi:Protein of unknown function (DUF2795)
MDAKKIASDIKDKLSGMTFPLHKDEMMRKAREWGVNKETIDTLEQLPARTYESVRDVADKLPIDEVKQRLGSIFK